MSEHKEVKTNKAPNALGPYSQAIIAGDFILCSGQIGLDPTTGQLVDGGIKEQTNQVIRNLKSVLEATESGLDKVVKCEVFLHNLEDFELVNEIYSEHFSQQPYPARVCFEVAKLPKNALIEISCVACKN